MSMKSAFPFLFFLLQVSLCVDAALQIGKFFPVVSPQLTWDAAQTFCEQHNTDLASIMSREETDLLYPILYPAASASSSSQPVGSFVRVGNVWVWISSGPGSLSSASPPCCWWIGLRKQPQDDTKDPRVWVWATGHHSDFRDWYSGQPDNYQNQENCVMVYKDENSNEKGWHDANCNSEKSFVCQERRLVLVKENKTWEEALEHCRVLGTELFSVVTQYSPPNQLYPNSYGPSYSDYPDHQSIYDLPSVLSENQTYVQDLIQDAITDEVWTGLRFLAGKWLWVNRDQLGTGYKGLPGCPVQGHYCGTLPKERAQLWDIQDCREKRNFLCYKNA